MIVKAQDLKPKMIVYVPFIQAKFALFKVVKKDGLYHLITVEGIRMGARHDQRLCVVGSQCQ